MTRQQRGAPPSRRRTQSTTSIVAGMFCLAGSVAAARRLWEAPNDTTTPPNGLPEAAERFGNIKLERDFLGWQQAVEDGAKHFPQREPWGS